MKLFGRWGYFWYKRRFAELNDNERNFKRLKFRITILEVNGQVRSRYAKQVILGCMANISRIQMLRAYLKERQKR